MQSPCALHPEPRTNPQVRPRSQSLVFVQGAVPLLQVGPASGTNSLQTRATGSHTTPRQSSPVGRQGTAMDGSQGIPTGWGPEAASTEASASVAGLELE